MGDHDRGTTLHGTVERLLYDLLALLIQGRSGLVQDKDLWVLDDGTCDRDSLLLTTGKFLALEATVLFEALAEFDFAVFISHLVQHGLLEGLKASHARINVRLVVRLDVLCKGDLLRGGPLLHHRGVKQILEVDSGLFDISLCLSVEAIRGEDLLVLKLPFKVED